MYVWLYIYLDIPVVVFIKVYIYTTIPQYLPGIICTYIFHCCVFSHPDFPFYFSINIVLFQCYTADNHRDIPKVVYEEHTTNQDLDHNFHHNQDLHILASLFFTQHEAYIILQRTNQFA